MLFLSSAADLIDRYSSGLGRLERVGAPQRSSFVPTCQPRPLLLGLSLHRILFPLLQAHQLLPLAKVRG